MFAFASRVPFFWEMFILYFLSFILSIYFQQQENKPAKSYLLKRKKKKKLVSEVCGCLMFVLALEEGNFLFR